MTERTAQPRTPTGIEFAQTLTTDSQPGKYRRRPVAEWIATIEAEAAASSEPLDVERLARAITHANLIVYKADALPAVFVRVAAKRIAAEYARLSEQDAKP